MLEQIPKRVESICLWDVGLGIQAKKEWSMGYLFPNANLLVLFDFFLNDRSLKFNKSLKKSLKK